MDRYESLRVIKSRFCASWLYGAFVFQYIDIE